jgi:glutathione S-transferase
MPPSIKPVLLHAMDVPWRPNPLKAAILLEMLGIPYKVKKWVTGDGENGVEGPVFTMINPTGRTPALEDPNTNVLVWESGAVLEYVIRTYDQQNQYGPQPTAQDKAEYDQWNLVLLTSLAPAIGELAFFQKANIEKGIAHFQDSVYRYLSILDKRLGITGSFILSQKLTVVDLNYYPWISIWELMGLSIDAYPHVQRWLKACQSEPAMGAAIKTLESASAN